uniref:GRAS54 n=1 Tax=Arundo donax TaxID=35708 RepID=A0A0A9E0H1_ARUDO
MYLRKKGAVFVFASCSTRVTTLGERLLTILNILSRWFSMPTLSSGV